MGGKEAKKFKIEVSIGGVHQVFVEQRKGAQREYHDARLKGRSGKSLLPKHLRLLLDSFDVLFGAH